jgi:hypothetical protein
VTSSILDDELILADTPGFGAGEVDGMQSNHEESLRRYLKDEVTRVFWVVMGNQALGAREKHFHDEYFASLCDDVVVTGCEDWEPNDRRRFEQRYEDLFGRRRPHFHFVSGKLGLSARQTNDLDQLELSGVESLEKRLHKVRRAAMDGSDWNENLQVHVDDLCRWLAASTRNPGQFGRSVWRPDSWLRWHAFAQRSGDFATELGKRLEVINA